MFSVFVVLLVILVIAVTVVLVVALPQLRSGSEILSQDGRQAVARAGKVARTGPIAVVGKLRPVSENLHAQFDRLEERDARTGAGSPAMVGPRSIPADSGPIPEVGPEVSLDVVPPRGDVVIDLRDPAPGTTPIPADKVPADTSGTQPNR